MAYPQLQPGQQYQQYQQPQQQHQQQYHPQQQQQQYVMIPGVGLTLVPVMHMPHHMGTPMSPNMSMQQHFMPPPMQNPYMQHMHAPHQQHNPYNQQGYAPVTARSAYKATASTLAAVALTSADGMVYLVRTHMPLSVLSNLSDRSTSSTLIGTLFSLLLPKGVSK